MKTRLLIFLFLMISISGKSQAIIYPDSLVSTEQTVTTLCYNNTGLMTGHAIDDRFLLYFNSDTIFLNVKQAGTWLRKTAYTGNNILLATLALHNDTIWVCWKEPPYIKTSFSANRGDTWDTVMNVSAAGNVSAPSMYASSNGKIHFVWFNESATDTTVLHNVYFNGTFLSFANILSTAGYKASWPSVTATGDTVLCSWKETHGVSKIYFAKSFAGGQTGTWSQPAFTNGANTGKDPNLSCAYDGNSNTHYTYMVYDGTNKIYIQHSTDFGDSWSSPEIISNPNKYSQFAKVESNNNGFVGVSWEHRTVVNLHDDTQKDVGFSYSISWADAGSFGNDSLAYSHNPFGSPLASLNKIDENNFYLVWLSRDTLINRNIIYERQIGFSSATGIPEGINPKSAIVIYPNPATNIFIIENKNSQIFFQQIKMTDVFGRKIFRKQISGSMEALDVSSLQNGIYFIELMSDTPETHKIIIQK